MCIGHVNRAVANVERSAVFYGDLLGLRVRWKGTTSDGTPAAHVGDDRSYLALFQAHEPGRAPSDYTVVGLNHFGYVVESLDAVKRRLANLGVEPHSEQDYEPGKRLYFLDPDGIEVELVEYEQAAV